MCLSGWINDSLRTPARSHSWKAGCRTHRGQGLHDARSYPRHEDAMPQRSKGARLWLEPANGRRLATWVIRDGKLKQRTGFRADQAQEAERALAGYIEAKYEAPRRRERDSAQVKVADVISIYAVDVAGRHARPAETAARLGR